MAEVPLVKCQNCGFLCYHDRDRRLSALTERERQSGILPGSGAGTTMPPICFVAAEPLADEFRAAGGDSKAALAVITNDRPCGKFMELRPGLSPKAHRKMQLAQDEREWRAGQEQKAREYQDKKDKEDGEYRDKKLKEDRDREDARRREDRDWRKEDQDQYKKSLTRSRWEYLAQLCIGLVLVPIVAALLAALLPILAQSRMPPAPAPATQPAAPQAPPAKP